MTGKTPQELSVKRAQVEFHNFASLGEPERVLSTYAEENRRRAGLLRKHREFIGPMSPFLEIGANAGHTSYMLVNDFDAQGFALDLSADALRHGSEVRRRWGLERSPVRIAGDAVHLPFADESMRLVLAFQMLSQFMDIERVFVEVKRVLAPGGIFLFAEEPMRRLASLRLYRCPYYDTMKPWERKLYDWGLLGYLVRDVIGAHQEESFGIRQNHSMGLKDWDRLVRKHFAAHRYELFVPERGWGERMVKKAAVRIDPYQSVWTAGRVLGGTLAAVCRKAGDAMLPETVEGEWWRFLRCPDCGAPMRAAREALGCTQCAFSAAQEGGVYNLLPSAEREELYPGARADFIDFSRPGHEAQLGSGWHQLEGAYGNQYRWMASRAAARLKRVAPGPANLRLRGHAPRAAFEAGAVVLEVYVNGARLGSTELDRWGLFVIETPVPEADAYEVQIEARPVWHAPGDHRELTVTVSMLRLVPRG